jgi:hypothetical protein
MPFALPDWLPWWAPLLLLLPALLYALAFLFMPFSVIGVKARLEVIEARLDEIQNEIRHLALRLPAGSSQMDFDEVYASPRAEPPAADADMRRPPIPPAQHELKGNSDLSDRPPPPPHTRPIRASEETARPSRSEPRLDWPRQAR